MSFKQSDSRPISGPQTTRHKYFDGPSGASGQLDKVVGIILQASSSGAVNDRFICACEYGSVLNSNVQRKRCRFAMA